MALALSAVAAPLQAFAGERPRVIVTTDGEGDDIASMHRFLLYANDFDILEDQAKRRS